MAITRKVNSGIEITEARGDEDVFPCSLPLQEGTSTFGGVWLPQRPNQRHKGLTLFSGVSLRHQGLAHSSTKGFLKAEPGLYTNLGARIHNLIGGSQG